MESYIYMHFSVFFKLYGIGTSFITDSILTAILHNTQII